MAETGDSFGEDVRRDRLPELIDVVMRTWTLSVGGREPWCSMPPDDRTGELRRVLEELLDDCEGGSSPTRRRRIRSVAERHGTFRCGQRASRDTVSDDFAVLRRTLSHSLCLSGVSQQVAADALRALVPDIREARDAARMAYVQAHGGSRMS